MSTTSTSPMFRSLLTSVPLENYVCREVIEDYFFKDKPFSQRRHVIVTSLVVFTTMASGSITPRSSRS